MDFDTEVMVRLYWQGNTSVFLPTRVTYPQDGLSHFDALKDNVRISLMHTRLFFGMLPRMPGLLFPSTPPALGAAGRGQGPVGMRLMLRVWKLMAAGLYRAAVAGDRRVLAYRTSGAAGLAAVD